MDCRGYSVLLHSRRKMLVLKKKFITNSIIKVRNTLKKAKVYDTADTYHRELKLIRPKSKTFREYEDVIFFCNLNTAMTKH